MQAFLAPYPSRCFANTKSELPDSSNIDLKKEACLLPCMRNNLKSLWNDDLFRKVRGCIELCQRFSHHFCQSKDLMEISYQSSREKEDAYELLASFSNR